MTFFAFGVSNFKNIDTSIYHKDSIPEKFLSVIISYTILLCSIQKLTIQIAHHVGYIYQKNSKKSFEAIGKNILKNLGNW